MGTRVVTAVLIVAVSLVASGCLVTSQRVAGRRAAISPILLDGVPGVAASFRGQNPMKWSTTEKIAGGAETVGWAGLVALVYELNRKANSSSGTPTTNIEAGGDVYYSTGDGSGPSWTYHEKKSE